MGDPFFEMIDEINHACKTGKLKDFLHSVSPDRLLQVTYNNSTFLHHLTYDRSIILNLFLVGVNINHINKRGSTPLMCRLSYGHYLYIDAVLLLIALGSNLSRKTFDGQTHLDIALSSGQLEYAKCLISNGSRLVNVEKDILRLASSSLVLFEKGVIACRDIVVTLLGLKRRKAILPFLDKFLIKQVLVVEIWSTRAEQVWQ